jgi:hypothetical protein
MVLVSVPSEAAMALTLWPWWCNCFAWAAVDSLTVSSCELVSVVAVVVLLDVACDCGWLERVVCVVSYRLLVLKIPLVAIIAPSHGKHGFRLVERATRTREPWRLLCQSLTVSAEVWQALVPVYLCELIPGLIGVAMLVYALFMAPKEE